MQLFSEITVYELITLSLFGFVTLIQIIYYWAFFARLAFYRTPPPITTNEQELPGVSVVISARDEYHHLVTNLPLLLKQDYPQFEVIVVNHTSSDETDSLLKELAPQYPRLKIVNIEQDLNFFKGKKFPLSIGIKSAQNELLLLTDADCTVASDQWIRKMTASYNDKTDIILGYGPYNLQKGFLNKLIRYDTVMVAMQYLSMALSGLPYMGVGRNLSYRKSLFIKNKGFTSHYRIASGDDDLFINQVAKKKNTKIEISAASYQHSTPKTSFKTYFRQKRRHLTTGKYYKLKFKGLLGLFGLSQLGFWLLFILLLGLNIQPLWVVALFVFRQVTVGIVQKNVLSKLHEPHLLLFSLAIEPLYVLILPIITLISSINQPRKWK